ncbi:ATP-binding protein [Neochlamydia sp. EPS4]|nr:ATP-binding protein [Neochlamydia sp. EPS4]
MGMNLHTCHTVEQTINQGYDLGSQLPNGSIVCLFGELGAGKTTFVKGLAAGAAGITPQQVNSPTFVYLNIYKGHRTVYHFDLYRLRDADEFLSMGFEDMLFAGGICCIEWSEKIAPLLPPSCLKITLLHESESTRIIRIDS